MTMTHLCNRIERDRIYIVLPNIGTIIQTAVDVNKFLAVYNDSKYLFLSTKINLKVDQFRRLYYKQGIKIKGP